MRRILIAVALIATLTWSTGSAGFLDPLRAFLTSLWSESSSDAGCGMDPSGRCIPASQSGSDEGCGMDPDGRCIQQGS